MKRIPFTFLLILLSITSFNVKAQVSADALKAAYLIKIANNFNWEVDNAPIKIGIFTNDRAFFFRLKNYSQQKTIGGRKIETTLIPSAKKLKDYDVVYISEEKNKNLANYKALIEGSKTLLFTDLAPTMDNSMINFYMSFDKKLKFKINSNLIKLHQFEPSSLMLILGGSDNDILSLFEEKDSSIVIERNRGLKLKNENAQQEKQLRKIEDKMKTIKSSLASKNIEIENKSKEIENINGKLGLQKDYLQNISKRIHQTSIQLDTKEDQISLQEKKLNEQLAVFEKQKKDIEQGNEKIKQQDGILAKQENLLNLKQTYLNYAYIFSLVLLGILVFAVISFLGKKKSSKKLAVQNEKLQKALDQLQTTQAKLVQNEKMASLGMVTAGMAHEINNPMTFVYTGVSILKAEIETYKNIINEILAVTKKGDSPKETEENLTIALKDYSETKESVDQTIKDIELGARRVTDIVQSLQNFSRLNEKDVKRIDLNEAVKSTMTILGSHARKKQVSITTNLEEKPIQIECFPASINQVFVNLISNAIDASPKKLGSITVNLSKQKETCIIKVIDNGPGIEPEFLGKIFDPFFTTKTIGKGTGLGLSISYNIIKKHNGNISVENNKSGGACFTIELPLEYIDKENA